MTVIEIKYSDAYDPAVVTTRAKLVLSDQPLRFERTERVTQVAKRVFYSGLVFAIAVIASRLVVGSVVLLSFPTALVAAIALVVIGIAIDYLGPLFTKKKDQTALVDLLKTWNQTLVYDKITLAEWLVLIEQDPAKFSDLLDHIRASPFVEQFDQAVIYLQRYVRFDVIAQAILNQPVVQDHLAKQGNYRIDPAGDALKIYKVGVILAATLEKTPDTLFNILEDLRKNNKLTKEQKEEITTFALSLNRK